MEKIKLLFDTLDNRKSNFVSFANGSLGGRMPEYIWYRLRYFSIKSLLQIFIYSIEFYLLFIVFNYQIATSILIFRLIGFTSSSFWWGALETLREDVRKHKKLKNNMDIAKVSKQWMKAAYYFIGVISVIYITLVASQVWTAPSYLNGLFLCYAFAIFLETNIRIIVLTLHSTCFAINRVYRPFYSIILPPIVGLIVLAILWAPLQGYSLVLSGLTQVGLSLYWTWHFSTQMLQHKRIPTQNHYRRTTAFTNPISFDMLKKSFASLLMESSGLIVLITLHDYISLYLLAPFIAICFSWSKLFYFDNIKYQSFWLSSLLQKLNHHAYYASLLISVSLSLIAYIIFCSITPFYHWTLLVTLFLFFSSRAILAMKQIILFTKKCYLTLITHNLILVFYIIIIASYSSNIAQLLGLISIGQIVLTIMLSLKKMKTLQFDSSSLYIPYYPWIDLTQNRHIFSIELSKDTSISTRDQIVLAIKQKLGMQILCTLKSKHSICFACPEILEYSFERWLLAQCGGQLIQYTANSILADQRPASNSDQINALVAQHPRDHTVINIETLTNQQMKDIDTDALFIAINKFMLLPQLPIRFKGQSLYVQYTDFKVIALLLIPSDTIDNNQ